MRHADAEYSRHRQLMLPFSLSELPLLLLAVPGQFPYPLADAGHPRRMLEQIGNLRRSGSGRVPKCVNSRL